MNPFYIVISHEVMYFLLPSLHVRLNAWFHVSLYKSLHVCSTYAYIYISVYMHLFIELILLESESTSSSVNSWAGYSLG